MRKVTGIGGVFFRANDPGSLMAWYRDHLGIDVSAYGSSFKWVGSESPKKSGYTVWCPFNEDTEYFGSMNKQFMINYRVADLPALMDELREGGVEIVGELEEHENGKFAWICDPEGNKLELWEPADADKDPYL